MVDINMSSKHKVIFLGFMCIVSIAIVYLMFMPSQLPEQADKQINVVNDEVISSNINKSIDSVKKITVGYKVKVIKTATNNSSGVVT